ncbi:MAG: alkaline serine protease [Bdellovibrio sp.]|nr:MAG: alkaline serine protease [Bdellovibrio sp.]
MAWMPLLMIILFFFNISCSQAPVEEVFPQVSQECQSKALRGAYLVKWKNGSVEVYEGSSKREEVIRDFVSKNQNELDFVEPVFKIEVSKQIKLSSTSPSWGLTNIEAQALWDQNFYGKGVIVAVIDSGVDMEHPQLQHFFINKGEEGTDEQGEDKRFNGIDDDQNGYVDDYMGYDFIRNTPKVEDSLGHGTHVTGIIAAQKGPNGVQGVAPLAQILPLDFIGDEGYGLTSDALKAMDYAVSMGAQLINASWGGGDCSTLLRDKIRSLQEKNILFITAAGNNSLNLDQVKSYPASFVLPSQITVGAISVFNQMAYFSNYGDRVVHLFAPGFDIESTVPGGTTASMSGTSMAAPFVTGAAALLLSTGETQDVQVIKRALLEGVTQDSNYHNQTKGRLNVFKAYKKLKSLSSTVQEAP